MKHRLCMLGLATLVIGSRSTVHAARAEAKPARTVFEAFRSCPTAPAALRLARHARLDLEAIRRGLTLAEPAPALVAWALSRYPHPGVREELEELLGSADQVAAYWAAKAVGRLGQAASIPALATQFPEKPRAFWEVAAGGRNARWKMYYFRYRMINGQNVRVPVKAPRDMPNIRVAYAATEALGRIGGGEAARILMRECGRDHYLIRLGAVRALGWMRHKPARPTLAELAVHDPKWIVRAAAEEALARVDGADRPEAVAPPTLPTAVVFIKARERTESNLGFRDSYPYPRLPWYAWGQDIYSLTPPTPDGTLRNLTNLTDGAVQGLEVSYDGRKLLFAMRRHFKTDGFHVFEMNVDGTGLRQLTSGPTNDVDPHYLPDGRIVFCSDRAGYRELYHQERSRVLYTMDGAGAGIRQISFNPNADFEPIVWRDGRILYGSYRFYGWDGGPPAVPEDPRKGISRIETVLHTVLPDGSLERLFYGSMSGGFYSTLRPMPYANQFQTTAWPRTDQMMGVSVSFPREMPDGRMICVTPSGLTLIDPDRVPLDCETPIFPEIMNLAGGEEVYIHSFDDQNPVGRYTAPYPVGGDWILVSHAPWHDCRLNGYGLYLMNVKTREMRLVYDDPEMSDVDAVAVAPRRRPPVIPDTRAGTRSGAVYCQSVFNSDLPFDRSKVASVRVMEAVQVGMSMNGNLGFQTRVLGTVPIASDGSFYAEVPADVPFRFALVDIDGATLVHETEFMHVRPGERKGCVGCHEFKETTPPNAAGEAFSRSPYPALRKRGDLVYGGSVDRSYNYVVRQ